MGQASWHKEGSLTVGENREWEEKKGEEEKEQAFLTQWQQTAMTAQPLIKPVACALAQIDPIPLGTKLRHTGEQSSHLGLPLQVLERDGFLQKAIQPFQEVNGSVEVV